MDITLGMEEELFLVDPESRQLVADPDPAILETCQANAGQHKMVRELLRSQIETNTRVCASIAEMRDAMRETRQIVIDAARSHGLAAMAASTHPTAVWKQQKFSPGDRYERFAATYQDCVRRFVISGMHIHAGFGDQDLRIKVMTAIRRYLPLLLALSTSSPFYGGHLTGFSSYRLLLVGGLPRTGMPGPLASMKEFDDLVSLYRRMSFVQDSSEIWWDIRPSHSFPTIELRICDVCTRLEDAVCVTALYAALVRFLARRIQSGFTPEEPLTEIIAEDRWVASRYGVFSHFGRAHSATGRVDVEDLVEELIEELDEDIEALACRAEIDHARKIIREGTSADRQLDLYRLRLLEGDSVELAEEKVVDLLLSDTSNQD